MNRNRRRLLQFAPLLLAGGWSAGARADEGARSDSLSCCVARYSREIDRPAD
jgi:hypothetical protein